MTSDEAILHVYWLHRFIDAVPFGADAPAEDIDKAHEVTNTLAAALTALRESHAEAVKRAYHEGWSRNAKPPFVAPDEAWAASEAKARLT